MKKNCSHFTRSLLGLVALAASCIGTPASRGENTPTPKTLQDDASIQPESPADLPAPRPDANSRQAHAQLLEKARHGGIDVYFVGDSITRRWGATDYPDFLAHWQRNFHGWNAGDFGWGGDRIENILWRLKNGELDAVNPRIIVVL